MGYPVLLLSEVVGALVSVVLIWVVTGVLVYMAIQRVVSMDFEIDATIMLITAAVGVGVNIMWVEKITLILNMWGQSLLYPPYPKDRGMLWFCVEAARHPQWC